MNDPIREAQARAAEFNAQRQSERRTAPSPRLAPERIALKELVEACEELTANAADPLSRARLVLALNAARNALQMGKVLDGIATDPNVAQGHTGAYGGGS